MFELNKDNFEMAISVFTPESEFVSLFNCDLNTLNKFCSENYNALFRDVYNNLRSVAMLEGRKALTTLAKIGNGKAIDILSNCFMKLDQDDKNKALRIVVSASVPKKEEGQ